MSERRSCERERTERPERRRAVEQHGGLLRVSARRVIDHARTDTRDEEEPDSPVRNHLWVLLGWHLVADDDAIRLDRETDELLVKGTQLRVGIDPPPLPGISWRGYYLIASAVGLLAVLAHQIVPQVVTARRTNAFLVSTFLLLTVSTTYRLYNRADVRIDDR